MSHVQAAARHLVGRDDELGTVVGFLDAREQLPRAIVLRGEAGIGKTTLWLAGIDDAAARGYRILSSRPSEAETGFSFAGLADLLGPVAGDVLPELPPIQRRALEGALLLGESAPAADDRAVAAAFLGVLQLLVADGPLCLAVDDLQWLDAASRAPLRFALARLDDEHVAALFAVRGNLPDWLRRAVPDEKMRSIDIAGLSVGATRELLRSRLDVTLPRPTLIRIWETSGGNPFFALELATALLRRGGTLAPGEELPIPSDLDELLHERLDGLSAAALAVACAVAALAEPTASLVEAAVGSRSETGLAETLAARILELDGERLRFTHPLLGSTVAARQTPAGRRSLNARLADVVPTAEEGARHLALATVEPDRDVAALLEDAARTAQARGATAAAAELAEQARRLTPASNRDDARRRLLVAADLHDQAGDTGRAMALLEQARAAAAPGSERATIVAQLARVQASPQHAVALYREALSEAEGDDAVQATVHLGLANLMRLSDGVERGIEHGELAVRAAARVDDAALRCRALAAYGLLHFNGGRGIPRTAMDEALSLERSLSDWPLDDGPTWTLGHQLWWSADVDRARVLFAEIRAVATARNDPGLEAGALWFLGFLEWRAGNWDDAELHVSASLELTAQLGRLLPPLKLPAAVIAAHRGRIDDARATAQGAIARAEAEGIRIAQSGHGWVLGFVELSLGDAAAALAYLRPAYELRNDFHLEPGMRLELGDLLEALVAIGRAGRGGRGSRDLAGARRAAGQGLVARDPRSLPGAAPRGTGRPRGRLRELRARAHRPHAQHRPLPSRPHAARARANAAARETAGRGARDPRGRARTLRAARRGPLGRAGPGRARAHRRPRALTRRADRGGVPDRPARRRRPHEPGGGCCAVSLRAHRRGRSDARLSQARHPLTHRARAPARARRAEPRRQTVGIPSFRCGSLGASLPSVTSPNRREWT